MAKELPNLFESGAAALFPAELPKASVDAEPDCDLERGPVDCIDHPGCDSWNSTELAGSDDLTVLLDSGSSSASPSPTSSLEYLPDLTSSDDETEQEVHAASLEDTRSISSAKGLFWELASAIVAQDGLQPLQLKKIPRRMQAPTVEENIKRFLEQSRPFRQTPPDTCPDEQMLDLSTACSHAEPFIYHPTSDPHSPTCPGRTTPCLGPSEGHGLDACNFTQTTAYTNRGQAAFDVPNSPFSNAPLRCPPTSQYALKMRL